MARSLTLTNIPDVLYERLKSAAALNRRSLSGEAIACLASALAPECVEVRDRVANARELRASLAPDQFTLKDIDAAKRAGRK